MIMSNVFQTTIFLRSFLVMVVISSQFSTLSSQSTAENLVYDGNTFLNTVGQSFKASSQESLETVSVLSPENVSDLKMVIYAGDGIGGRILATLSNISLHKMSDENDFSSIDVSESGINLEQGESYTFYFLSEVSLGGSSTDVYSDGIMYLMDVDMEPFELAFRINACSADKEDKHSPSICSNN